MNRRVFLILTGAALPVFSQAPADDDVILRAMRDELDRSRQLRVVAGGGDDIPYFISYSLTDAESFRVTASMGAVMILDHNRSRVPVIEVRVGSYDFDNTGHIYSGIFTGSRFDGQVPLDDNYASLREALWLATDRAYKGALESMARKRAALNSVSASADKLPDFSKAEPVQSVGKLTRRKFDEAAWTARTVKLSSVFAAYPEVNSSGVEFESIGGSTYLMNSEGTTIRYQDEVSYFYAKAEGQAADGMIVRDAATFQGLDITKFASEAELQKGLTAVAENIRALSKAPAGSAYTGPVMFEPQAAAQLFAQLLGENVAVPRKPLSDPNRAAPFTPSELESRIGSRILPEWIDVKDDPTQTVWNGKPLAGTDLFDLEGVRPKAVSLVEKGVLKSFLTTRQPLKNLPASNGHARLPDSYGVHRAAISNLFVKATQNVPLADLKKKLIDMSKERDKPYGMLVRKLDFPFSAGAAELRQLRGESGQSGGSSRLLSPPILVYRVYPDGREELVRGLRFRGVTTRSLRDIVAASQETAMFDFVNNAAPLAFLGAGGYLSPTSVIAPGMLFDEMELELPQEQLPKLPIVPRPSSE